MSDVKKTSRLKRILFDRPILKLVLSFLAMVVLSTLAQATAKWWKSLSVLGYLPALLALAAAVYSTILIVRIFSLYLIRKPLAGLLTAQDIFSLLLSYAVFILGILLLLSLSFLVIEHLGLGCLTYAPTGDPFTREMIDSPSTSHEYFYFAAVTFFTIGYGDICPLGLCKIMAVVTAFAGNIVTVVLMAIVVSLYLNRRTKPPDQASTIQSERSMEKS